MKIADILHLEDGVSGISCTGEISYVGKPTHKSGESHGKPYSFWSQFIVLKENGNDIGVNLSATEETCLNDAYKGRTVTVKGKIGSYTDKEGVLKKTLQGYIQQAESPQHQETHHNAQQAAPQSNSRDDSIIRQCCIKAVLGAPAILPHEYSGYLNACYAWVTTGKWPLSDSPPDRVPRVDDGDGSDYADMPPI